MAVIPFRARQCIVSLIGTVVFLPVYLFWGGVFSFSFSARDSLWAWGFGIVACWFQILAILYSFFQPRKAACWMLLNTTVSILMTFAQLVNSARSHVASSGALAIWLHEGSGIMKIGLIFWVPPLIFAMLLLRRS